MAKYTSRVTFRDEDNKQAAVAITSDKCFYQVAVMPQGVHIIGPGVDEFVQPEEVHPDCTLMDYEEIALIAVILFESGDIL